ncbi:MAG: GNAT family N-acetyltransferase [Allosphingosinicella sp.]
MRLRVATPGDHDAVATVLGASFPALWAGVYPPELLASALPFTTRPHPPLLASGRYYLVESEAGAPAGCGGWSGHPPGSEEADFRRAHIRHFATHPDFIRRGVGRLLYERCEADARAVGFRTLECYSSLNGEAFYVALGFRRLEAIEVPMPGGIGFPSVRMERPI